MNVSLWRPWPPLPSFAQPVPPPGVEPDSGPCICVQFAPAWQPYILGALDQLTNAQTWDTSDPDVLSTTLAQVAQLREMFGASTGCSMPPPAPPITPTDDIDCKIASYLVRTVAKEILQAAINIAFPPAEGLSIFEYLLDALPDVGDFLGIFGLTSKSLSTTILGYVTLPWVETATEDAVWDAIGCTVYNGVKGVHSITDGVLAVIQPAIEALDVAFPEFLTAVASIFGDLGSDVLTATAELANVTDFNCSGCTDPTPIITGTDPQTYLPRRLEVRGGAVDTNQVRRLTLDGGTLVVDSGTIDAVTYTPASAAIDVQIAGTDEGQFDSIQFVNGGGVTWSSPTSGEGAIAIEATVASPAGLEVTDGVTDLTDVMKVSLVRLTLGGTSADATISAISSNVGVCTLGVLPGPGPTPLGAMAYTGLIGLALAPQTYLFSANISLTSTASSDQIVELDLFDGTRSLCVTPTLVPAGATVTATLTPYPDTLAVSGAVMLRAYAAVAGVQANVTGRINDSPATWFLAMVAGGGSASAWCYTFNTSDANHDFETAWAAISRTGSTFVPGTGWMSHTGSNDQTMGVQATFPVTYISTVTVSYSCPEGNAGGTRAIDAGTVTLPLSDAAGPEIAALTVQEEVSSIIIEVDTYPTGSGEHNIITAITVEGIGVCPFGVPNC